MNDKKEGIKVNTIFRWNVWSLLVKRQLFGICLFAESFVVDENDNVEEEGGEDEDDAAEDPNGKGSQSSWVRGGWREGRVEHVHQNLFVGTVCYIMSKFCEEHRIYIRISPAELSREGHSAQDRRMEESRNLFQTQKQKDLALETFIVWNADF